MPETNPKGGEDSAARLADIRERIQRAARAAGREDQPRLVAVSKTFEADDIKPLIEAGQRLFGENRVQEAASKWPALKDEAPDIELHLIGPLQTNKLRQALALFDVFHTLDRMKLAEALVRARDGGAEIPRLFVQVNIGAEPQKAGILPDEADAFIEACRRAMDLPIGGLMCIPPVDDDPRPYFDRLREIAARHALRDLSMGMSADFEMAVQCGATYVRVGSALFGSRPPIRP